MLIPQCSEVPVAQHCATCLAALLAGVGFAGYHTLFGQYLGMNMLSDNMLSWPTRTFKICSIKFVRWPRTKWNMPNSELGSWHIAVMRSDRCWQIEIFFTQISKFVIDNSSLVCFYERNRFWYWQPALWRHGQITWGILNVCSLLKKKQVKKHARY